jgi:hypothetical protein
MPCFTASPWPKSSSIGAIVLNTFLPMPAALSTWPAHFPRLRYPWCRKDFVLFQCCWSCLCHIYFRQTFRVNLQRLGQRLGQPFDSLGKSSCPDYRQRPQYQPLCLHFPHISMLYRADFVCTFWRPYTAYLQLREICFQRVDPCLHVFDNTPQHGHKP